MDNARNKHGPENCSNCQQHGIKGAPPGVMMQPGIENQEASTTIRQGIDIPLLIRTLITRMPRDSAARSRAPAFWRRMLPDKPAFQPVMGEVCKLIKKMKYNFVLTHK
ncbi:MAG: hypothetical protein CVU14_10565 [Bacteroidetes bacterium HGW-Bacteroidetes-9]|jgi:hypothetical protein|nr:MAG: hypothetical protein CVU14_10565 [Bacteroidetes bacterium HGW-Bacteroidetes-9]